MEPSSSTTKSLPNEDQPRVIFYYMAKDIIHEPSQISRLSQTCRRLSTLLGPLLYRADVLEIKREKSERDVNTFQLVSRLDQYEFISLVFPSGLQSCWQ